MKNARILSAVSITVATLALTSGLSPAVAESAESAQATSSFELREHDGARTVDITNVTFSTTGSHVPRRPEEERLLLRTTTRTREVIDEKGLQATITVDAWPLGTDPAEAPIYSVSLDGVDARVEDNAVIVFERGTEDVAWQSVHSLGTGAPLFDTFVPMLRLSSPDTGAPRFVGLDVPPDDASDPRLRDPHVVGVLVYASPERTIRRLLITCSNVERAAAFRSYWDTTRQLSLVDFEPPKKVLINWWPPLPATWLTDPDAAAALVSPNHYFAVIPIVADDLDVAHASMHACIALAPWSQ